MIDFAQESMVLADANDITKPQWSASVDPNSSKMNDGMIKWLRRMGYQVPILTALMASEIFVPQVMELHQYTNTTHTPSFGVYNSDEDLYRSISALFEAWNTFAQERKGLRGMPTHDDEQPQAQDVLGTVSGVKSLVGEIHFFDELEYLGVLAPSVRVTDTSVVEQSAGAPKSFNYDTFVPWEDDV